MSELRKLADATEYLFKEVCKVKKSPHLHIHGVKSELGKALSQLSRAAAEQEALSPTLNAQDAEQKALSPKVVWSSRDYSPMGICTAEPKGSSVEYYRDRLVRAVDRWILNSSRIGDDQIITAYYELKNALSAPPDPEGEWQWVPNTCVVVPKEPTSHMADRGETGLSHYWTKRTKACACYEYMIDARPPVPKKGERG